MKLSIIIPVYNKLEYTQACLNGVLATETSHSFEVIVIDNASSDGTRGVLEHKANIRYARNDENLGFARACNQGARLADGEYVLFLNNDTLPLTGWLDALVRELDEDMLVAVAGSKLLYADGTIQHAGVVFGEDKIPYHIYRRERAEKPYVNKKREFQCVTGACLLIRKSIFDEVGGFDEGYVNGYEDVDLCLKVGGLGKKIMYCPESVLYHYESMSDGRLTKHDENKAFFLERWAVSVQSDDMRIMHIDGTLSDYELVRQYRKLSDALKQENDALKSEIRFMKSSKFWKFRERYEHLKDLFRL